MTHQDVDIGSSKRSGSESKLAQSLPKNCLTIAGYVSRHAAALIEVNNQLVRSLE
jgi:hypothetical protein